jgi:hypothetical protein
MAGREKYQLYKRRFSKNALKQQRYRIGFSNAKGIKEPDRILNKNRLILERFFLSPRKPYKVAKERLLNLGFAFDFYTGINSVNDNTIYLCYEYFYLAIDDNWYTIGRKKTINPEIHFPYDIEKLLTQKQRN